MCQVLISSLLVQLSKAPMAILFHHLGFAIISLLILPWEATAASSTSDHRRQDPKSLHFALFQHETINKTGYIVVNGVAGQATSQTTTPFGTLFVFNDQMTVSVSKSSKVRGIAEGTSITTSLDGLRSLSIAKITLRLKQHQGSISIVGETHNTKPADYPVVGGTGDFLFVQGYVRSSPVDLTGLAESALQQKHKR